MVTQQISRRSGIINLSNLIQNLVPIPSPLQFLSLLSLCFICFILVMVQPEEIIIDISIFVLNLTASDLPNYITLIHSSRPKKYLIFPTQTFINSAYHLLIRSINLYLHLLKCLLSFILIK